MPVVTLPLLFVLMSYNLNQGNPDPDSSMDAIEAGDADIVVLQETNAAWQTRLEERFAKLYPHRAFHPRPFGGLAVLSKHPIKANELLARPKGAFSPAQRFVADTPLGEIQILNVHLRPNVDRGNWLLGWKTTPPIRRHEIETYWKKLSRSLPTIVAGDFNEAPDGSAVGFLADKGLSRVATKGPTTWHHAVRVGKKRISALSMDIDHVVVDRAFKATGGHVVDAGASDHRPVVVTLARATR
ncbi:MAG: endonuclease/exonuclease/phosphatase family protein [Kofleriaceae bacterium]